jgi:site-specific recombinase XerD
MCKYSFRDTGKKENSYRFAARAGDTPIRIKCKDWDKKNQRVISRRQDGKEINHATKINSVLSALRRDAEFIINDITLTQYKVPNARLFKDSWISKNKDSKFWHCFDNFYEAKKREGVTGSTLSNYRGLSSRLKQFEGESGTLSFLLMSQGFLDDYVTFVRNMDNPRTGEKFQLSTIDLDISNLTHFLNYSYDREWHNRDKFKRWKRPKHIVRRKKKPKHLTNFELSLIENLDLSGTREIVRDIFVFMCNSGLRIGEYNRLTHESRKNVVLEYEKGKPKYGNVVSNKIEMNFYMISFFEKYDPLPKFSGTTINKELKIIAALAGVDKPISTHFARHTFVNVSAELGINPMVVSQTTGHSDIKITEEEYNKTIRIAQGAKLLENKRIEKGA